VYALKPEDIITANFGALVQPLLTLGPAEACPPRNKEGHTVERHVYACEPERYYRSQFLVLWFIFCSDEGFLSWGENPQTPEALFARGPNEASGHSKRGISTKEIASLAIIVSLVNLCSNEGPTNAREKWAQTTKRKPVTNNGPSEASHGGSAGLAPQEEGHTRARAKRATGGLGGWPPRKKAIRGSERSEPRGVWGAGPQEEGHTKARLKRAWRLGGSPQEEGHTKAFGENKP
jgi:hypothetical protein